MRVLLFSSLLYLLGVAVILFFRPQLMFHMDGRWKEFGTGSDDKTLFPFWLFCIVWAVVSYGLVLAFVTEGSEIAASTVAAATALANVDEHSLMPMQNNNRNKNKNTNANANMNTFTNAPPRNNRPRNSFTPAPAEKVVEVMKPGYYKLDKNGANSSGTPRYIYVGEETPDDESVAGSEESR